MILIADPQVLAVPIEDNQEKLVDMRCVPDIQTDDYYYVDCLDLKHDGHAFVREGVKIKLLEAQACMPQGWHLKLIEGHRNQTLQTALFDLFYTERQADFPDLPPEDIFLKTTEVVSPIYNLDGTKNVPPHGVGGAVDVKVVNGEGAVIPMGPFLEEDVTLDSSTFHTNATNVPDEYQENRHKLCSIMESVGFANYPFEWWHYSYGDRYWAFVTGESKAVYGLVA